MIDVAPYLNQLVHVARAGALADASGTPAFGAPEQFAARVELKPQVLRQGAAGATLESDTEVWLAGAVAIGDRLWLPGDDSSKVELARTVLAVTAIPDLNGATLYWQVSL